MKNDKKSDISKYAKSFSKNSLFKKIKHTSKAAGISVVYAGLLLFYTFQKATTPRWAKASIISSLGYFISPLDGIPDIIPALGYTDDFAVLALAIGTVYMFIDDKVKHESKEKLKEWFGKYDDRLLKGVDKRLIKEMK